MKRILCKIFGAANWLDRHLPEPDETLIVIIPCMVIVAAFVIVTAPIWLPIYALYRWSGYRWKH